MKKGVKLSGIGKDFLSIRGKIRVLNDVHLTVEPGELFVIVGPSGCGKSTLLNIIAGLENPTSGEIWIGETLVVSTSERIFLPPKERNIAMVFQNYALYPHMSVYENIAFPLRIAKLKNGIDSQVKEIAHLLEISHLLSAKPAELSGGQRQRVAIGRAIVRRPTLFLLDEPLSNLDAQLRVSMRAELKRLQKEISVTTLYVTHDQVEAMTLGDRIAVLEDGQIQQVGTPEEIYYKPQNIFVATFIGSPPMNLIDARVSSNRLIEVIGTELKIEVPLRSHLFNEPKEILIGVRPEHIQVTKRSELPVGQSFGLEPFMAKPPRAVAKVKLIESLGSESIVHLELGSHTILAKAIELPFKENEEVNIYFDTKSIHFFEKSGNRIDYEVQ